MLENHKEYFEILIAGVEQPAQKAKDFVYSVEGGWGVGKSLFADNIRHKVIERKLADAVFHIKDCRKLPFLYDFVNTLFESVNQEHYINGNIPQGECYGASLRFSEAIRELKSNSTSLFEKVFNREHLLSQTEYRLFKDVFDKSSLDSYSNELEAIIKKKSDKRLIQSSYSVVSESFIVDVMSLFPNDIANGAPIVNKRKILIIIDNYDQISGGVARWLSKSFFKYCRDVKFKDFISFNIELESPEMKVSDILDFRFILTGRKNYLKFAYAAASTFDPGTMDFALKGAEIEGLDQIIQKNSAIDNKHFDDLIAFAASNPAVASLLRDMVKIGALLDDDISIIYQRAAERILRFYTEEQRDWIQIASFLDDFGAKELQCFSLIGDKYKYAFNFLKLSDEMTEPAAKNTDKYRMKTNIKEFIRRATTILTPATAKEYETIADFCRTSGDFFNSIPDDDYHLIKNLAYFKRFNLSYAIDKAYQSDAEFIRELIERHKAIFDVSDLCYSLKTNYHSVFDKFNYYADKGKYEDKKSLAERIWEMFQFENNGKIEEIEAEIKQLKSEKANIKNEIEAHKKNISDHNSKLTDLKEKLRLANDEKAQLEKNSNYKTSLVFLAGFLLFALISYITLKDFKQVEIESIASIILSAGFLFAGAFFGIRAASSRSKSKSDDLITGKIQKLESEIDNIKAIILKLEQEEKSSENLDSEISGIIAELEKERTGIVKSLEEPFV